MIFLFIKEKKRYLLIFMFMYFAFGGEISKHYMGASLDISNGNATFIDKIEIHANPHWVFSLSSDLKVISLKLNGEIKDYTIQNKGPSITKYKIKRQIWEPRDALITIQYKTLNSSLFNEIIPGKLVQLKASELFYSKGSEFTSNFEFHFQIPESWDIVSDGNVSNLKDNKSSYNISSSSEINELNIFFLKNYNETPQLNKLLFTLHSNGLALEQKQKIISQFFKSKLEIEKYLGSFPYPKFDLIISDYYFESNSIKFLNHSDLDNINFKRILFKQYFIHYLYPENIQNKNWIKAIECYLLDYLPLLQKNKISAKLYRKELLTLNSKSILPKKLKEYSENYSDIYEIQNYLFLLFTIENHNGNNFLIDKIKELIQIYAKKQIGHFDAFSFLLNNLNLDVEFYLNERFSNNENAPYIEIVESDNSISILQPEKVLPMLIPIKYHNSNSTIFDSTLYTKSFKTILLDKNESSIQKVEIDPNHYSFRKLGETEVEAKINDIFYYDIIQLYISPTIKNDNVIISNLKNQFPLTEFIIKNIENLDSGQPSIIIGELPIEYKFLSTKSDLILNGRKFYLKNHCLAYTFNNQFNHTNLIIYSKSEDQILPVVKKLKFFKNYGYFILRNGNNAEKGTPKTHSKHLVWNKK